MDMRVVLNHASYQQYQILKEARFKYIQRYPDVSLSFSQDMPVYYDNGEYTALFKFPISQFSEDEKIQKEVPQCNQVINTIPGLIYPDINATRVAYQMYSTEGHHTQPPVHKQDSQSVYIDKMKEKKVIFDKLYPTFPYKHETSSISTLRFIASKISLDGQDVSKAHSALLRTTLPPVIFVHDRRVGKVMRYPLCTDGNGPDLCRCSSCNEIFSLQQCPSNRSDISYHENPKCQVQLLVSEFVRCCLQNNMEKTDFADLYPSKYAHNYRQTQYNGNNGYTGQIPKSMISILIFFASRRAHGLGVVYPDSDASVRTCMSTLWTLMVTTGLDAVVYLLSQGEHASVSKQLEEWRKNNPALHSHNHNDGSIDVQEQLSLAIHSVKSPGLIVASAEQIPVILKYINSMQLMSRTVVLDNELVEGTTQQYIYHTYMQNCKKYDEQTYMESQYAHSSVYQHKQEETLNGSTDGKEKRKRGRPRKTKEEGSTEEPATPLAEIDTLRVIPPPTFHPDVPLQKMGPLTTALSLASAAPLYGLQIELDILRQMYDGKRTELPPLLMIVTPTVLAAASTYFTSTFFFNIFTDFVHTSLSNGLSRAPVPYSAIRFKARPGTKSTKKNVRKDTLVCVCGKCLLNMAQDTTITEDNSNNKPIPVLPSSSSASVSSSSSTDNTTNNSTTNSTSNNSIDSIESSDLILPPPTSTLTASTPTISVTPSLQDIPADLLAEYKASYTNAQHFTDLPQFQEDNSMKYPCVGLTPDAICPSVYMRIPALTSLCTVPAISAVSPAQVSLILARCLPHIASSLVALAALSPWNFIGTQLGTTALQRTNLTLSLICPISPVDAYNASCIAAGMESPVSNSSSSIISTLLSSLQLQTQETFMHKMATFTSKHFFVDAPFTPLQTALTRATLVSHTYGMDSVAFIPKQFPVVPVSAKNSVDEICDMEYQSVLQREVANANQARTSPANLAGTQQYSQLMNYSIPKYGLLLSGSFVDGHLYIKCRDDKYSTSSLPPLPHHPSELPSQFMNAILPNPIYQEDESDVVGKTQAYLPSDNTTDIQIQKTYVYSSYPTVAGQLAYIPIDIHTETSFQNGAIALLCVTTPSTHAFNNGQQAYSDYNYNNDFSKYGVSNSNLLHNNVHHPSLVFTDEKYLQTLANGDVANTSDVTVHTSTLVEEEKDDEKAEPKKRGRRPGKNVNARPFFYTESYHPHHDVNQASLATETASTNSFTAHGGLFRKKLNKVDRTLSVLFEAQSLISCHSYTQNTSMPWTSLPVDTEQIRAILQSPELRQAQVPDLLSHCLNEMKLDVSRHHAYQRELESKQKEVGLTVEDDTRASNSIKHEHVQHVSEYPCLLPHQSQSVARSGKLLLLDQLLAMRRKDLHEALYGKVTFPAHRLEGKLMETVLIVVNTEILMTEIQQLVEERGYRCANLTSNSTPKSIAKAAQYLSQPTDIAIISHALLTPAVCAKADTVIFVDRSAVEYAERVDEICFVAWLIRLQMHKLDHITIPSQRIQHMFTCGSVEADLFAYAYTHKHLREKLRFVEDVSYGTFFPSNFPIQPVKNKPVFQSSLLSEVPVVPETPEGTFPTYLMYFPSLPNLFRKGTDQTVLNTYLLTLHQSTQNAPPPSVTLLPPDLLLPMIVRAAKACGLTSNLAQDHQNSEMILFGPEYSTGLAPLQSGEDVVYTQCGYTHAAHTEATGANRCIQEASYSISCHHYHQIRSNFPKIVNNIAPNLSLSKDLPAVTAHLDCFALWDMVGGFSFESAPFSGYATREHDIPFILHEIYNRCSKQSISKIPSSVVHVLAFLYKAYDIGGIAYEQHLWNCATIGLQDIAPALVPMDVYEMNGNNGNVNTINMTPLPAYFGLKPYCLPQHQDALLPPLPLLIPSAISGRPHLRQILPNITPEDITVFVSLIGPPQRIMKLLGKEASWDPKCFSNPIQLKYMQKNIVASANIPEPIHDNKMVSMMKAYVAVDDDEQDDGEKATMLPPPGTLTVPSQADLIGGTTAAVASATVEKEKGHLQYEYAYADSPFLCKLWATVGLYLSNIIASPSTADLIVEKTESSEVKTLASLSPPFPTPSAVATLMPNTYSAIHKVFVQLLYRCKVIVGFVPPTLSLLFQRLARYHRAKQSPACFIPYIATSKSKLFSIKSIIEASSILRKTLLHSPVCVVHMPPNNSALAAYCTILPQECTCDSTSHTAMKVLSSRRPTDVAEFLRLFYHRRILPVDLQMMPPTSHPEYTLSPVFHYLQRSRGDLLIRGDTRGRRIRTNEGIAVQLQFVDEAVKVNPYKVEYINASMAREHDMIYQQIMDSASVPRKGGVFTTLELVDIVVEQDGVLVEGAEKQKILHNDDGEDGLLLERIPGKYLTWDDDEKYLDEQKEEEANNTSSDKEERKEEEPVKKKLRSSVRFALKGEEEEEIDEDVLVTLETGSSTKNVDGEEMSTTPEIVTELDNTGSSTENNTQNSTVIATDDIIMSIDNKQDSLSSIDDEIPTSEIPTSDEPTITTTSTATLDDIIPIDDPSEYKSSQTSIRLKFSRKIYTPIHQVLAPHFLKAQNLDYENIDEAEDRNDAPALEPTIEEPILMSGDGLPYGDTMEDIGLMYPPLADQPHSTETVIADISTVGPPNNNSNNTANDNMLFNSMISMDASSNNSIITPPSVNNASGNLSKRVNNTVSNNSNNTSSASNTNIKSDRIPTTGKMVRQTHLCSINKFYQNCSGCKLWFRGNEYGYLSHDLMHIKEFHCFCCISYDELYHHIHGGENLDVVLFSRTLPMDAALLSRNFPTLQAGPMEPIINTLPTNSINMQNTSMYTILPGTNNVMELDNLIDPRQEQQQQQQQLGNMYYSNYLGPDATNVVNTAIPPTNFMDTDNNVLSVLTDIANPLLPMSHQPTPDTAYPPADPNAMYMNNMNNFMYMYPPTMGFPAADMQQQYHSGYMNSVPPPAFGDVQQYNNPMMQPPPMPRTYYVNVYTPDHNTITSFINVILAGEVPTFVPLLPNTPQLSASTRYNDLVNMASNEQMTYALNTSALSMEATLPVSLRVTISYCELTAPWIPNNLRCSIVAAVAAMSTQPSLPSSSWTVQDVSTWFQNMRVSLINPGVQYEKNIDGNMLICMGVGALMSDLGLAYDEAIRISEWINASRVVVCLGGQYVLEETLQYWNAVMNMNTLPK